MKKNNAINERYVNIVCDIPKYSLKVLKITYRNKAVNRAPKASIKKSFFGYPQYKIPVNWFAGYQFSLFSYF